MARRRSYQLAEATQVSDLAHLNRQRARHHVAALLRVSRKIKAAMPSEPAAKSRSYAVMAASSAYQVEELEVVEQAILRRLYRRHLVRARERRVTICVRAKRTIVPEIWLNCTLSWFRFVSLE